MLKKIGFVFAGLCLLAASVLPASAGDKAVDADLKLREATLAMMQFLQSPDMGTARYLLRRAKGVAIFPDTIKAGFILGAEYGEGVVLMRRMDGSWSDPAFFQIGGASVGLQAGANSTDLMLVVMTQKGLDAVMNNNLQVGVSATAAAGPVGRDTQASLAALDTTADLYSYSRSSGLFAGISLDGAAMEYDEETTSAYYGRQLTLGLFFQAKDLPEKPVVKELKKVLMQMESK